MKDADRRDRDIETAVGCAGAHDKPGSTQVLIDLDNTLVDRSAAFATWAQRFVGEVGGARNDLEWLFAVDSNGYIPRRELARAISARFELNANLGVLTDRLRRELLDHLEPYQGVLSALERLHRAGMAVVVVTNGTEEQQHQKLERTGLGQLVRGVVVSKVAGVRKPDPEIFELALSRGGGCPESSWMIGDHPELDIAAARSLGLSTGWVSHSRPWPHDWTPTVLADTTAEVLGYVIERIGC